MDRSVFGCPFSGLDPKVRRSVVRGRPIGEKPLSKQTNIMCPAKWGKELAMVILLSKQTNISRKMGEEATHRCFWGPDGVLSFDQPPHDCPVQVFGAYGFSKPENTRPLKQASTKARIRPHHRIQLILPPAPTQPQALLPSTQPTPSTPTPTSTLSPSPPPPPWQGTMRIM